jgi:hypothetical protein
VQFVSETDVVLEFLRFEDRMPFQTHAAGGNMVRCKQLGTVQLAAGAFSAGRP